MNNSESAVDLDALLDDLELLQEQSELKDPVRRIFDYTQLLLDDDDHLTPTGNLNAGARESLRTRIRECFQISPENGSEEG